MKTQMTPATWSAKRNIFQSLETGGLLLFLEPRNLCPPWVSKTKLNIWVYTVMEIHSVLWSKYYLLILKMTFVLEYLFDE